MYIRSEQDGITYSIEPSIPSADQFNSEGFTSTCVTVEDGTSMERPNTKRGACFYIRATETCRPQRDCQWLYRTIRRSRLPGHDMTFICPIILHQMTNGEPRSHGIEHIYHASIAKTPCELKISYGMCGQSDQNPDPILTQRQTLFPTLGR